MARSMTLSLDINGAHLIITGENLSVSITESVDVAASSFSKLAARLADESAASIHESPRKAAEARATESEAKASDDNGTYQATEGTVRREMQVGEGRAVGPATSEIMDVTGGERAASDGGAIAAVKAKGRLASAAGVEPSPSEPITRREIKPLRPHCRKPGSDECGGYGSKHCRSCEIAAEARAA